MNVESISGNTIKEKEGVISITRLANKDEIIDLLRSASFSSLDSNDEGDGVELDDGSVSVLRRRC